METPGHKKSEKWENIWARSQLSGSSGWWQDGATGFTILWVWVAPPLGGGLGVGGVGGLRGSRGLRGLEAGRHALIHLNGFAHVTAKGRTWTRGWRNRQAATKAQIWLPNSSLDYISPQTHSLAAKYFWVILLSRLLRNLATQVDVYFASPKIKHILGNETWLLQMDCYTHIEDATWLWRYWWSLNFYMHNY